MADVTAIIPTFNEESNIKDCINSLRGFAENIILMDNYSTDKTKEIAESLGAKVIQSEKSYKERLNEGINLDEIATQWVLNIDADERLTPDSCKELTKLTEKYGKNKQVNGIVLHYYFVFMGKLLKHGFHPYKMRLFKKGAAFMENKELDEHFVLKEGKSVRQKTYLIHHDFKGMDSFILKLNSFSQRVAKEYWSLKEHESTLNYEGLAPVSRFRRFVKYHLYYKIPIIFRSHLYYIYYYYFNLGFLDGTRGKMFQWMYIYWYKFLSDCYIYEHKIELGNGKIPK